MDQSETKFKAKLCILQVSNLIYTHHCTPSPECLAMEERAVQRAERRKQLEEAKKKREDEKLASKTSF